MRNDPPAESTSFACPSCGNPATGQFCGNCGEQRLGSEDRSLKHYLDITFDFLTPFNSKVFRSLRYLISKPGFLSAEQLRGSRVRYAKPLSLFVAINVVYYFSIAYFGANTFTTPLSVQLHQNDYYPAFANHRVEKRIQEKRTSPAEFERKYNEKSGVLSKTLIFLFIPIYAVIFYGFFFKRRRYVAEHFVVATHFWSFILLVLTIAVPILSGMLMWWTGAPGLAAALAANDNLFSIFLQIVIGTYMTFMMRRVYGANLWLCGAAAVLISWSFFHIVWLYRFLLFVITLYSL